jgi:very-short-patch-repair endonuclease
MSRKLTHEEFVERIEDLNSGEYTLLSQYNGYTRIVNGKKEHLKLQVRHNSCNTTWEVSVANFIGSKNKKGTRCPVCQHPSVKRDMEWVKEKVYKLAYGEYTVLSTEYESNKKKLMFRHNHSECDNHEFPMTSNDFINQDQRCPRCAELAKESRYVKFMRKFFTVHGIDFQTQKTFEKCRGKRALPFDFFLPEYNLLIEYDGVQHRRAWNNDSNKLNETKRNDGIKNEFAKNSEYSLMRLSCKLETLAEVMNDFFNLRDSTTIERYKIFYIE